MHIALLATAPVCLFLCSLSLDTYKGRFESHTSKRRFTTCMMNVQLAIGAVLRPGTFRECFDSGQPIVS